MTPDQEALLEFIIECLAEGPKNFETCLDRPESDPIWDLRPDPERFTAREVLAHLADWEKVFQERIRLTLEVSDPPLPNPEPFELLAREGFASRSPRFNLDRFILVRSVTIALLQELGPLKWDRAGIHPTRGKISLLDQACHMTDHDSYHFGQLTSLLDYSEPE